MQPLAEQLALRVQKARDEDDVGGDTGASGSD
jgi:hypothetical protein